jgi:hypothetical protein
LHANQAARSLRIDRVDDHFQPSEPASLNAFAHAIVIAAASAPALMVIGLIGLGLLVSFAPIAPAVLELSVRKGRSTQENGGYGRSRNPTGQGFAHVFHGPLLKGLRLNPQ